MNPLLTGLAANPALPPSLLDRLVALAVAPEAGATGKTGDAGDAAYAADEAADAVHWLVSELAARSDLGPERARALAAHDDSRAVTLAYAGWLTAADVDPQRQPYAAVALLDEGRGSPLHARLLAAHPDSGVRWKLASCPDLPQDVQDTLAADPDTEVVAEFALWAGPRAAARLARHPHAEVRYASAVNEDVPPDALAALVTGEGLLPATSCLVCDPHGVPFTHHPYAPVPACEPRAGASCGGTHASTVRATRLRAAGNPSTPVEAVLPLAGAPSVPLRRAVAGRAGLPQDVYARLARDPDPGVLAAVASNPALGERLVRLLATDPRPEVRRAVADHPRLPLDVLARLTAGTRAGPEPLPRLAAATAQDLAEAAASPQAHVRVRVAQRRDLPPEVRDALAADRDASVVAAVAPHPGLSEALLRAAVARYGVQVHGGVAANPDAPGALLEELARHEPPVRAALRKIAVHPNATPGALLPCLADSRARSHAAAHPALPPEALIGLLSGPDASLACAAAANPALPAHVGEKLLARYAEPGVTRPVS